MEIDAQREIGPYIDIRIYMGGKGGDAYVGLGIVAKLEIEMDRGATCNFQCKQKYRYGYRSK